MRNAGRILLALQALSVCLVFSLLMGACASQTSATEHTATHLGDGGSAVQALHYPPPAYVGQLLHGSASWAPIAPLMYEWYSGGGHAEAPRGPFLHNWLRIPDPGSRRLVFYIAVRTRPNEVQLLRYPALLPDALPRGTPRPVQCTESAACSVTSCLHNRVVGQCVVVSPQAFRGAGVLVVYCEWLVPGVPLSVIKRVGPVTDAASWGVA